MVTIIRMIAITISNSINENPDLFLRFNLKTQLQSDFMT